MKPTRNSSCPCGSGRKYKRCCLGVKPRASPLSRARQVCAEMALPFAVSAEGRLKTRDLTPAELAEFFTRFNGESP